VVRFTKGKEMNIVAWMAVVPVVVLAVMVFWLIRLNKRHHEYNRKVEQVNREAKVARDVEQQTAFQEKWDRMLRIDTKKIADQTGVSVTAVEEELGWPSLWKAFAQTPNDIASMMTIGRRLHQPGVKELLPQWHKKMDVLVPRTSVEELQDYQLLRLYQDCPTRRDLETRLVSGLESLHAVFRVSAYLSNEGKGDCQRKIERVVRERANVCKTPDELRQVMSAIPREEDGRPICTCDAIGIVIVRAYQIYRPLIVAAQSTADLDKLEIPDLGRGRGECLNLLRCELKKSTIRSENRWFANSRPKHRRVVRRSQSRVFAICDILFLFIFGKINNPP